MKSSEVKSGTVDIRARFEGHDGRRLLTDALQAQRAIGDVKLANLVADKARLIEYGPGDVLIDESAPDNHMHFLLTGDVSILINGREIATRTAGDHIGEMALLDPSSLRSASAVACNTVLSAMVPEPAIHEIAKEDPALWRNLARELTRRLRQRNRLVRPVNRQPTLFLGSSSEALRPARAIQTALEHDPITVVLWADGTFEASRFPIESLHKTLETVDFAALILAPDDIVASRESQLPAPRDNVVFELGLFMGALGRARTFLVCPRHIDLKIPTDLTGITPLSYDPTSAVNLQGVMASACTELRTTILQMGPR